MTQHRFLLVTFPAQGHINPSLQLVKRLIRITAAEVTYVTALSAHSRIANTSHMPRGLTFAPFSMEGYDDGYKSGDDIHHYMSELRRRSSQAIKDLVVSSANENDIVCSSCKASRWKLARDNSEKQGVAAKTLWYFPLILRFRRMFQFAVSAKELTWHPSGRKKDGLMRHPADFPTWKMIDAKWPDFGLEPRNLRIGLSSDRFNPFGILSST